MRTVITVNGQAVYSDKQVSSIKNTRVNFADGSWCDVATGEVVNRGAGYVNIGTPGTGSGAQSVFGPKSFHASALVVRDIEADVEIEPGAGPEMTVTIAGSKTGVENIETVLNGDQLVIAGKGGRNGLGTGSIVIGGGTLSIRGSISVSTRESIFRRASSIVTRVGDDETNVKVRVEVPVGSTVEVSRVQGTVNVGDTDGPFSGNVLGDTRMTIGKVRGARLSVQGSGDIHAREINGNLSISIQGSGDIDVSHGEVQMLQVSVMGSGDATFGGNATDADLSVMGSGDVDVHSVTNRPRYSQMGSGNISVDNW